MKKIILGIGVVIIVALIFVIVRDTKRYVDRWQYQKRQKREAKVQELYSKALNNLYAHHNMEEAKALLKDVLLEEPEHINSFLKLGDISLSEEDFQKAREYYHKAREMNPKNFEALFALEQLMEKTGRWSDALRYVEEVLDMDEYKTSHKVAKKYLKTPYGK